MTDPTRKTRQTGFNDVNLAIQANKKQTLGKACRLKKFMCYNYTQCFVITYTNTRYKAIIDHTKNTHARG